MSDFVIEMEQTIIETFALKDCESLEEAKEIAQGLIEDGQIWNLPRVGEPDVLENELRVVREPDQWEKDRI